MYGLTGDHGPASHRDVLCRQRAVAVQAVLAQRLCRSAFASEPHALGDRHLVDSGATEGGREKNPRVMISFPNTADTLGSFATVNAP